MEMDLPTKSLSLKVSANRYLLDHCFLTKICQFIVLDPKSITTKKEFQQQEYGL